MYRVGIIVILSLVLTTLPGNSYDKTWPTKYPLKEAPTNPPSISDDDIFNDCGTDEQFAIDLENSLDLQSRTDDIKYEWQQYRELGFEFADTLPIPLRIPINFHIISSPESDVVTYGKLVELIKFMNRHYTAFHTPTTWPLRPDADPLPVGDMNINFEINQIIRKDQNKVELTQSISNII